MAKSRQKHFVILMQERLFMTLAGSYAFCIVTALIHSISLYERIMKTLVVGNFIQYTDKIMHLLFPCNTSKCLRYGNSYKSSYNVVHTYKIKEQTIENSSYITFLLMLLYKTTANIKALYNTKMSQQRKLKLINWTGRDSVCVVEIIKRKAVKISRMPPAIK